ncbi:MAG: hypothetical protein V4610_05065 [Pseudomonadota bacterium]|jgi:hypothetical protein
MLCLTAACSPKGSDSASNHMAMAENIAVPQSQARDDRYRTVPTPATTTGTWYQAGAYRVRSRAAGVLIAPTPDLPSVAYEKKDDPYCHDNPPPKTVEGKWVRSRGWRVSEEDRLGPFTVVGVLRRGEHGPGGECQAIDGRFVVFDHGRPIATVVTASVDGYQLNQSEVMASGALRLSSGPEEPPYGDLILVGRDLEITPLPPSDKVCDGRRTLPNIFARQIVDARKSLFAAGWNPVSRHRRLPALDNDGYGEVWSGADYLYHDGVTEVEDCDPRSRCQLGYRARGAKATVFTRGDEVTAYVVDCAGRGRG